MNTIMSIGHVNDPFIVRWHVELLETHLPCSQGPRGGGGVWQQVAREQRMPCGVERTVLQKGKRGGGEAYVEHNLWLLPKQCTKLEIGMVLYFPLPILSPYMEDIWFKQRMKIIKSNHSSAFFNQHFP